MTYGVDVEGTATLISRSCTTSWLDWVHGELWLTDKALIRTRLSLSETLANGTGDTLAAVAAPVAVPPHLSPELVVAGHPTNRYIALAEIEFAALHRGHVSDRLNLRMRDGGRNKLLWLSADPAYQILREALRRGLDERLTVD